MRYMEIGSIHRYSFPISALRASDRSAILPHFPQTSIYFPENIRMGGFKIRSENRNRVAPDRNSAMIPQVLSALYTLS
jgi:hypothetical protein